MSRQRGALGFCGIDPKLKCYQSQPDDDGASKPFILARVLGLA